MAVNLRIVRVLPLPAFPPEPAHQYYGNDRQQKDDRLGSGVLLKQPAALLLWWTEFVIMAPSMVLALRLRAFNFVRLGGGWIHRFSSGLRLLMMAGGRRRTAVFRAGRCWIRSCGRQHENFSLLCQRVWDAARRRDRRTGHGHPRVYR